MVTLGATCLYWSTSVLSVPPCVPGSVPFMPCQKVTVTGAEVVAGLATAVATPDTAVAATGAPLVQASATRHSTSGSRLKTYMIDAPSAFQAATGDALQELTLDEDEQD